MVYKYEGTKQDLDLGAKLIVGHINGSETQELENECAYALKAWAQFMQGLSVNFSEIAPLVKLVAHMLDCAEHIESQTKIDATEIRKVCIKFMSQIVEQDPNIGDRMSYWAEAQEEQNDWAG